MAEPAAGGKEKLEKELEPDHKGHWLTLESEGQKCKESQGSVIS